MGICRRPRRFLSFGVAELGYERRSPLDERFLGDLHLDGAAQEFQKHTHSFGGRQHLRYEDLETLQRPMSDLNFLPNLQLRINCNDFVQLHTVLQACDRRLVNGGKALAELKNAADARGVLDPAMIGRVVKPGEEIAGKHSLDEPDWTAPGELA
jgi:hypothetical protein